MTVDKQHDVDPDYQQVLSAGSEEEALRLEAALLAETDKGPPESEDVDEPVEEIARGGQLERILARARSQIGYREGPNNETKYGHWYGVNHQPWCAMFISWVFYNEGLPLPATISKGFARTLFGAQWFQRQGRWARTPARGHVVFYDLSAKVASIDHVGIVDRVNSDGSIMVVEGNTSGAGSREGVGVFLKKRTSGIAGYGVPRYRRDGGGRPKPQPGLPPWPGRYLKQPPAMVGGDVSQWQRRMKRRGWRITVDGRYDERDERICRAFQREKGLKEDGIVGADTWKAAWQAPVT